MHKSILIIVIQFLLCSSLIFCNGEEYYTQKAKKLCELNQKSHHTKQYEKEFIDFINQYSITDLSNFLCKCSLDGAYGVSMFSTFSKRLFLKDIDKLAEIDSIFRKCNIYLAHLCRLADSKYYYSENIINYALKVKKNNDYIGILTAKRYIITVLLEKSERQNVMEYCKNQNLQDCFEYGEWALFDNDIATPYKINLEQFSIELWKNSEVKIFNGHGKLKELYFFYSRIKKLSGKTKDGRKVTVELPDIYGWQTIRLPDWVKDNYVEMKISEIYPGSKFNDLMLSEIKLTYKKTDPKYKWYQFLEKIRIE